MTDAAAYAINVLAVNDLPAPPVSIASRASNLGASGSVAMDYRGPRLTR